jgi:hypothetical protein
MALAWAERLQEAAYTGPDGTRQTFQFADVSKTIRKKTTAHDSPDVDSTYVEDLGLKGALYPLTVYFSGENHDLEATEFEGLLDQRGPGVLDHPMYGTRTVIPFGDITRSDALVSGANQTTFTITFWETIAALYPDADADTLQLVDDAVASYDVGGAAQFDASIDIADAGAQSQFVKNMQQLKDGAASGLRAAQDGTGKLQSKMRRISQAIDSTLETFVGGPLTLAFQFRQLINAPARSAALLRARLDAYGNLATSLISGTGTGSGGGTGSSVNGTGVVDAGTGAPGTIVDASNTFHANRMTAEVVVLGIALAVSGETYRTRQQALEASLELGSVFDSVVDWSELNYAVLFEASVGPDPTRQASSGVGSIDTGEARQVLLSAVSGTMAYLIVTSFTLGVEKSFKITTPRTAVDLVAELYGGIDRLNEFIDTNNLTGDQIMELPIGLTVRYYAE